MPDPTKNPSNSPDQRPAADPSGSLPGGDREEFSPAGKGVQVSFFRPVEALEILAEGLEPGSEAYEKLFEEGAYPVGQTIKINRIPFRVVGVLEAQGGSTFGGMDNTVYVPLSTAQTRLYPSWRSRSGEPLLSTLYVQVADQSLMDQATEQIAEVLRQRHRITFRDEDDFTIINHILCNIYILN